MNQDYRQVTELAGDEVTQQQIQRAVIRYGWAREKCIGLDVLEVACGTGQGLGCILDVARSVSACDITPEMAATASKLLGNRADIRCSAAEKMPWDNKCFDVIILFEAIYYLQDINAFFLEAKRLLRPNGKLLIVTCNKDLWDFNSSPFAVQYYGVVELHDLVKNHGLDPHLSVGSPIGKSGIRQRLLRPIKAAVSNLGLMPRTMRGKKLLKRLVFGSLQSMPTQLSMSDAPFEAPEPISLIQPNRTHQNIFCECRTHGLTSIF